MFRPVSATAKPHFKMREIEKQRTNKTGKGGDVFVCRMIPNMKPQSVWNLMHGLSLLNEVMRDS